MLQHQSSTIKELFMSAKYALLLLFFSIPGTASALIPQAPQGFGIGFDVSMNRIRNYSTNLLHQSNWLQAKRLYEQHIITKAEYSEDPRIPEIIHWIWLGSPFPENLKAFQETWKVHHPTWKFMLWTEKEIEELGLTNKKLYDTATNYGEKSDIARYEILYRIGGLYVDTDFECLRPFDIFHHCCDFYTGLNCGPSFMIFNGIIASRPGHPILENCIAALNSPTTLKNRDPHFIEQRTGPIFFTGIIQRYMHTCTDKTVIFPTSYFYPWPFFERKHNTRAQIEKWIMPETFAIHHWHTSWMKK